MSSRRSRDPDYEEYIARLTSDPRRRANDSSPYGGNHPVGSQRGGMPPQNYSIPSNQSYPQGSNFAYGAGNPSYYGNQSNTLPNQAAYPAGGPAAYPTIAPAQFAPGGQAGYALHGQQQYPSYGQAPPLASIAPYHNPLSADSTSYTSIHCNVPGGCGELIIKLYKEVIEPRDIATRVIRDPSSRLEYTSFFNQRTGKEVARVCSDGGTGPCSWHMRGTVSVKEPGKSGQVDIESAHGGKKSGHGGKKSGHGGKQRSGR